MTAIRCIRWGGLRQAAALLIPVLIAVGCGGGRPITRPQPPKKPTSTASPPSTPHVIPIIDADGTTTPKVLKEAILKEYQRWPVARGGVSRIELHASLEWRGIKLLGSYNHKTRVIRLALDQPAESIRITLHHEIGHAIWSHALDKGTRVWWAERYEQLRGLKSGFPTEYSARSLGEFFAEHVAIVATYPQWHARTFPIESAAFEAQGVQPNEGA